MLTCNNALSRRSFTRLALSSLPALGMLGLAGCGADAGAGADDKTGSASSSSSASASSASDAEVVSTTLFAFDTVVQISAQCEQALLDKVAERCTYFENKFSRTVEGSDIWNINNAHGAPVEVCAETAACIQAALEYAQASGGLFDITIGAVSSLWDFVEGVKPTDEQIAAALPHVGYGCVELDGATVTLSDPDAMLDLGGIAKGYICDDLVRLLREGGCANASISLGGNVYVMGMSFDGDEWTVGVQDPNGAANDVIATIPATDVSLVTSGLYERGFERDGVFYYHILDPKTGYPVATDLESASIRCESSTTADAYSTILFLLGHDAAKSLVDADDRFEAVFVDDAGAVTQSSGGLFTIL